MVSSTILDLFIFLVPNKYVLLQSCESDTEYNCNEIEFAIVNAWNWLFVLINLLLFLEFIMMVRGKNS